MALNPFFLQGSQSEQRLTQDLINEHLKIFGVEVTYIPRKFVRKQTIIKEVQSSAFDDNFLLEAYVNTFEGYGGQGDIMTKFGVSLRDELTVTISKERFEDFISPFLEADEDYELASRPREGDIIFFPLGARLFEVKFVEHEDPFYQLGKNYVYQLKCELFEYEDEVIDTSIGAIDTQVQDEGYITTLNLIGIGRTATAEAFIQGTVTSGYVNEIFLNHDGYGYTSAPTISITASPTGQIGDNASAVGFITTRGGVTSVEKILLTNAGAGYVVPPSITITGGGGVGASATCSVITSGQGVIRINVTDGGVGYSTAPTITIGAPPNSGIAKTAVGIASIGRVGNNEDVVGNDVLNAVYIQDPGRGYSSAPTVIVSDPDVIKSSGNYIFNELVYGERSLIEARVKSWDADEAILRVSHVGIGATTGDAFFPGELIIGRESGAQYPVQQFNEDNVVDKYTENDIFESEADSIIDFSEGNPFGTY